MTSIFLDLAISKDGTHFLGHYGNDSSWHGQYNLYFDRLFDTHQFPPSVFDMETKFYPTVADYYGPALDSGFPQRAKTDWIAWLGGVVDPGSTRSLLVNAVSRYFRQARNGVFGDLILTDGGWSVGFRTRPVAGGHYSLLALDTMDRMRKRRGKHGWNWTGLAIGLLGAVLVAGFGRRLWQRRRARAYRELIDGDESPLLVRSPRAFSDDG